MMEMMDRTRRSIMIMGTFVSPVEIEQLNKKIIKAKKKDVTVRILVITSRSKESEADIIKAFRPIKNDVRLHVPQLEGPNKLDDRYGDDGSGIARWVIIDRREILLALTRPDEKVPDLDSAIAMWVSNASIAQYLMRPHVFDKLWEDSEQIEQIN
jgi:hypothetical protein